MTPQPIVSTWDVRTWAALVWLYDHLVGFIVELTRAERALLLATLCFAGVGAHSSYLFYQPVRGTLVGGLAAIGIELLYIGGAGVAVRHLHQQVLAWGLILVGFVASAYFGVMVSLREALPAMFGIVGAHETGTVQWPSLDQWLVFGGPAIVEGLIPALAALGGSILLHSMVSQRLTDDDAERKAERAALLPFECPFCTEPHKTASALFGHYGRCAEAQASPLSTDEKKLLIARAVAEGKKRLEP